MEPLVKMTVIKRIMNIKVILSLAILMISLGTACTQSINQISLNEFEQIKINNNALSSIWNSKGESFSIESLFGKPLEVINHNNKSDLNSKYNYKDFSLSFSQNIPSKGNLTAIHIWGNTVDLIIKGSLINVGDNISKLGKVKFNIMPNGQKSILFSPMNDETIYLVISFDNDTNIITEVKYFVLT